MQAKITCVYNEGAMEYTPYIGAKGLSLLVETDTEKILFDVGMRGGYLIHNLEHMHIKPASITKVVLSHNHKSNIRGLAKLLTVRKTPLDVFANTDYSYPMPLFNKEAGKENQTKMNLHRMESDTEICDGITAIGPFGELKEFFLLIRTTKGPVVLSSCYHCGTRVVMDSIRDRYGSDPCCLIGGIHLPKVKQKAVDPTVEILKEHGSPELYINHCGTPSGITYLRTRFGLSFVNDFYVGESITVSI